MAAPEPKIVRRRLLAGGIFIGMIGIVIVLAAANAATAGHWLKFIHQGLKAILVVDILRSRTFWIGVALILLMEWLWPVRRQQRLFSAALIYDAWWLVLYGVFSASIIGVYVSAVYMLFDKYLDFLALHAFDAWAEWLRVVLAIVIADFLRWFRHWLDHRIRELWYFHAVHHAARELTQFTGQRVHFVEIMANFTISIIPSYILAVNVPTIVWFGMFVSWHGRLLHANVRTNLGWLRYILVTPQAHRIHHSVEQRHFDVNFGTTFIIWDRLFGTYYGGTVDEYPETGINDPDFPIEINTRGWRLFASVLAQIWYPFCRLVDPTLGPRESHDKPGEKMRQAA